MLAGKLVDQSFKPLRTGDHVQMAIAKMDAWQTQTLPVTDQEGRQVIGMVSFEHICDLPGEETVDVQLSPPVVAFRHQHIFEIARMMLQHELRFLPICDEHGSYVGVIRKTDLLDAFSKMLNIESAGSVITVELPGGSSSISELVQLIEQEEAKILGLAVSGGGFASSGDFSASGGGFAASGDFAASGGGSGSSGAVPSAFDTTLSDEDETTRGTQVSIKLNIRDTSVIVAKLRRYGYETISENRYDAAEIDLTERAGELMHYLDL